jgi:hypothetical protein
VVEFQRRADALVARAVAAGELREDRARVFGLALLGMVRVANVRVLQGEATWGELTEPLVELFLQGARR